MMDANLMTPGKAFVPMGSRIVEPIKNADEEGNWITIDGTHILIKSGETAADAFKRTTGKDLKSGDSDKGAGKRESKGASSDKGKETKAPTKPENTPTPIKEATSPDTDKALMRAMSKESNKETGNKIAVDTEKNLSEHMAYGKSDAVQNSDELGSYTGSGYKDINSALRDGDTSQYTKQIAGVDKIISSAPNLPDGTVLYRGMGEHGVSTMMNMKPGEMCADNAFQSFSTSPFNSMSFTMAKDNPNGGRDKVLVRAITDGKTPGLVIGGAEHEVLFGRGTGWTVVSNNAVKQDRLTTIHIITVVPK